MITTKDAFLHAATHVKDLYENAYDIRLEEVDHVSPFKTEVEVTVSFLIPATQQNGVSTLAQMVSGVNAQTRIFKKVIIDKNDGSFISLKMMK